MHFKTAMDSFIIAASAVGILMVNSPLVDWQNKTPSDIFGLRVSITLVLAGLIACSALEIDERSTEED